MASANRISGVWQRRVNIARRVVPAIMTDLKQSAEMQVQFQLANLIYSKPEDINPKTGRKKWVRTGRLRNSETVSLTHTGDTIELVLRNTAPYAVPRHEANKPGHRRINPARTAHWHDETVKVIRLILRDYAKQAAASVLRGS